MAKQTILFLGVRRGAILAAHRLGLNILAFTRNPVKPSLRKFIDDIATLDFGKDIDGVESACREWFGKSRPAAIVPLTESAVTVAASLRERFDVPGFRLDSARKFNDKMLMKQAVIAAGIPCASFRMIQDDTDMNELANHLGLPLVIKEINNSGGRGLTIARTTEDLASHKFPGHMAEAFVSGVEFSVESIIHRGEVHFQNITEYFIPGWANIVPNPFDEQTHQAVSEFNQRVLRALNIDSGITHLELFMTNSGLLFGEIAARPPGGYIMDLIRNAYDFCPWRAFIETQLDKTPTVNKQPKRFAGALILHPGIGHVKEVLGVEAARKIPGVSKVQCGIKPGDFVGPRLGTGQSKGFAFVRGETHAEAAAALRAVNREVKFVAS